jgi:hypothetical protein
MITEHANGNGVHHRLTELLTEPVPTPPLGPVDVVRSPTRPASQVLRSAAIFAARWLLGEAEPHAGPLSVTVQTADGSIAVRIRPTAAELANPVDPFAVGPRASFFATDEKKIVRALAEGPLPLKVLVSRLKIERSRCATIVGNLRDRKIILTGDDGYELTAGPWVELAGGAC